MNDNEIRESINFENMVKIVDRYKCPKDCPDWCGICDDIVFEHRIAPFEIEEDIPIIDGHGFVKLHLCDVGMQIYDEFVDYVLFHMDYNGQDESDFLKEVKDIKQKCKKAHYNEVMFVSIDSDLLTGMNLLYAARNQ